MIQIFTGFVGSGKSYHAVRDGVETSDIRGGKRWVIANFPIKPKKRWFRKSKHKSRWIFKENDDLTVKYLVEKSIKMGWYGQESRCLLIIDEAGVMFNSRDWNVKPQERKDWIKFLSQSRKFGYDIIFICQDVRMMDRQIRSLAEYEVQHKKINNWSFFKFLPFTLFVCVSFWNGVRNIKGSVKFVIYRKKVANRYDTMGLFDYGKEDGIQDLIAGGDQS